MTFSTENLRHCLNAAVSAAYQAGARIMKYYGQNIEVGSKGREHLAGDVVTIADREAQEILARCLEHCHPDIGFCAEEDGQDKNPSRFEKPAFWCIDPMDGTLPFLQQSNGFGVSIGLISREGEPLLGVCYAPALRNLYTAFRGGGAFKNGEPLRCGRADGMLRLILAPNDMLPPRYNAGVNDILDGLKASGRMDKYEPISHIGAVLRGCRVADTPPAISMTFPRPTGGMSIWDYAAAAAIVTEAGGWITDMYGAPLELNRRETTYMHHRGCLAASDEELARIVIERFGEWEKRSGGA